MYICIYLFVYVCMHMCMFMFNIAVCTQLHAPPRLTGLHGIHAHVQKHTPHAQSTSKHTTRTHTTHRHTTHTYTTHKTEQITVYTHAQITNTHVCSISCIYACIYASISIEMRAYIYPTYNHGQAH